MSVSILRQSIMACLDGGLRGRTYSSIAVVLDRNKPKGIYQVMSVSKNNYHFIPSGSSYIMTIKNTSIKILRKGDTLFVVE
jgi:hypothetical protein